jgi:hypothetical protein
MARPYPRQSAHESGFGTAPEPIRFDIAFVLTFARAVGYQRDGRVILDGRRRPVFTD